MDEEENYGKSRGAIVLELHVCVLHVLTVYCLHVHIIICLQCHKIMSALYEN